MVAPLDVTAVYEPVESGWTQARLVELPGVVTAAPTREEATELLLDALREYMAALLQDGPESDRDEYERVVLSFSIAS